MHAFLPSADIFQFFFFFLEYHQSDKPVGFRSGLTFVGPDLGLNCLQDYQQTTCAATAGKTKFPETFTDLIQIFNDPKIEKCLCPLPLNLCILCECSGSVVECLTRDRGAADSSLTGVTELCH